MKRRDFIGVASGSLVGLAGLGAEIKNQINRELNWFELAQKLGAKKGEKLRLLFPKGCLANLKPIIKAFEDLTGAKVEVIEAGFASIDNDMLKTHLLGKSSSTFDVAIPSTFAIPDLAEAGVIESFDSLIEELGLKKVLPTKYDQGDYYKGQHYGRQSSGDVYLLFLKKSWFSNPENQKRYEDRYGYPLMIPRSWEELDRQMAFFHDPAKNQFGGCMFRSKEYLHWEYWMRLHGQRSYPFRRDMEPLINDDKAKEALRQMKASQAILHPSTSINGPYENFKLFVEGNCYANFSWGGGQKFFNSTSSPIRNDLIITQAPGIKTGNEGLPISYFNWGWSYVMSAKGQQKRLAFLFILLASSSSVSGDGVAQAEGFLDPFLDEHFDHEEINKVYGRPYLDALKLGLENAMPDLYIRGYAKYFSALRNGLHSHIFHNVPIDFSLKAIADKWRVTTDELGEAGQIEQWKRLKGKYPSDLVKHLEGF